MAANETESGMALPRSGLLEQAAALDSGQKAALTCEPESRRGFDYVYKHKVVPSCVVPDKNEQENNIH
jgi:hypothetical protein